MDKKAALDKAIRFIEIIRNHGVNVQMAYLFGSYVNGKPKDESDIDVAVISKDFLNKEKSELLLWKLRKTVDVLIEPVIYHPKDFVDENPLVWEIKKNGRLLV